MASERLWITGATGFVGGHFVYHVLKHSCVEIVALVRQRPGKDARERLLDALELVAASYREAFNREAAALRIRVVHGDITRAGCDVDTDSLPASAENTGFWHIAASLSFEDKQRAEIRLHNVEGTQNALELAQRVGAQRFVHVSTAYSCGRVQGQVPEEMHDLARTFNNVYEQSKCEAEHLVAEWGSRTGCAVAIVRPSIVVGPKATHEPGGSDTGLYGFVREVYRLRRMLQAANQRLVMKGDAPAPVNLIAVDDVVREMWRLFLANFDGRMVHHVTSDEHPDVARLLAAVGEQCGIGAIETVCEREREASPVERLIDRRAEFYGSYLRDAKRFERRSGPVMQVNCDDLQHYIRQYLKERRGEGLETTFERTQVRARDQRLLVSYRVGRVDRPTLLLCNAYGVPTDVWVPLARALASEFNLVTWEQRAIDEGDESQATGPDLHAADMRDVLTHYGISQAFVVGWCTGADISLRFAELHPERVSGVVGLGGALNGLSSAQTSFQCSLRKLVDRAAADLRYAELYHQVLFGQKETAQPTPCAASDGDPRAMLSSMLDALDPALLHMTSTPFRDPQALHGYARTMRQHYAHAARRGRPAPDTDVLLVVGEHDDVAHPEASRSLVSGHPRAVLLELPDADHFAVYTDARIPEAVRRFVRNTQTSPLGAPSIGAAA